MIKWLGFALVAVLSVSVGVLAGSVSIGPGDVFSALRGAGEDTTRTIVVDLRLPRALLAFLVGGCLAMTGATLQALVRNPLADPYLLGLSGGAGLGAVIAIAFRFGGAWAVPVSAFVGALVAIWLVYRMAVVAGGAMDTRILILSGVVVSAFTGALLGAVVSLSPAAELRNAMLWLLGGFSSASWTSLFVFSAYAVIPVLVIVLAVHPLDVLSLGEETAGTLGVDVEKLKRTLYVAASLLTAAAVSVSGIIGFVGLVIPHAVRLVLGHAHRSLMPAAFLLGGSLVTLADALARTAFAPREIPVGVVTALVGVPLFAILLRRTANA